MHFKITQNMDNHFIKRNLADVILDASKYFSVITITGPRQSGKTTLIRHLFDQLPYYSLESIDIRSFALNDPLGFLSQHAQGMILDEVHNAPALLSYIQQLVDNNPEKRFILSGSSQFSMLKNVTQSLAGRTAVFELMPLSYSEIIQSVTSKSLDNLLFDGFYPAIYAKKNKAEYLYPAYIKTYLEKDVRDILQIKDMLQFQTFLKLCAGRIGSLFNASELSNEVGVSTNTIIAWLSVMQASYIIHILPPFFDNSRKRLTKTPKIYFTDTGLACNLLGIESAAQLARDKMRGFLFENFIVSEALKHRFNQGKASNAYFYRDSHQNEVDLLLKTTEGVNAFEIKSAMTYNPQFEKALKQLSNWITEPVIDKTIVYSGEYENSASEIKLIHYSNFSNVISGN